MHEEFNRKKQRYARRRTWEKLPSVIQGFQTNRSASAPVHLTKRNDELIDKLRRHGANSKIFRSERHGLNCGRSKQFRRAICDEGSPFVGDTPLGKTYSSAVLDNFTLSIHDSALGGVHIVHRKVNGV